MKVLTTSFRIKTNRPPSSNQPAVPCSAAHTSRPSTGLLLRLVLLLSLMLSAGCSGLPFSPANPVDATPTINAAVTETPSVAPTMTETATPSGPVTLRIWLPPEFDPSSDSKAANLLQAQLKEFSSRRPGVRLDVRIKAMDQPGELLEALSAASAAAPSALPDLVALPHSLMEAAALKGLLYPYDGLTATLDNQDWFDFAHSLASLQDSTYGIPFAGDVMLLVYRSSMISDPPRDWSNAEEITGPLAFPAASPESLYTLTLYLDAGGKIQDEVGRPLLETGPLTSVLNFYQQGAISGLTPPWLVEFETEEESWLAFTSGQANMAVTWASRYFREADSLPDDVAATSLPAFNGTSITLADGWVWAMGNPKNSNRDLAVQLAEFLTDSGFLANWTSAAGYLPPRSSALSSWTEGAQQSLASQVVLSAQVLPPADLLSSLGQPLQRVSVLALRQQGDPAALAESAVSELAGP